MTRPAIDAIRRFQEFLLEVGVGRSVLALPAPRMLALTGPNADEASDAAVFTFTVTEPEIVEVSRDLFASGHYSIAVQEAYKAVETYVRERASSKLVGTSLMDNIFSPNDPTLFWSERATVSQEDEHKGYHRLFSGAMLGIRNPVTHEFNWVDSPDVALELLVFAQHLMRKAKAATLKAPATAKTTAGAAAAVR